MISFFGKDVFKKSLELPQVLFQTTMYIRMCIASKESF